MRLPALITLLAFALPAYGDFLASSQILMFDPQTQLVSFTLEFSEVPDFLTSDAIGRPANAWQVRTMRAGGSFATKDAYDSIVLSSANQVIVRTMPSVIGFPTTDTTYGFFMSGTTITFSAPISAVAPSHPDGIFEYEVLSWDYGSVHELRGYFFSEAVSAPEPSTTVFVVLALVLGAGLQKRRLREP